MRIRRGQVIEGLPAHAARKLMRTYRRGHGLQTAADVLGVNKTTARSVLQAFCKAGYLKIDNTFKVQQWTTTLKGNALANAPMRTIKRETAERQLAALIDRARAYNADPSKVYTASQITVFGSYLSEEQGELGDIDIAFTAVRRFEGDEYEKRKQSFMDRTERNFKDFFEHLCWPELDLHYHLKSGSPSISLTTEDITRFTNQFRCVYKAEDDPRAIQPSVTVKLGNSLQS